MKDNSYTLTKKGLSVSFMDNKQAQGWFVLIMHHSNYILVL